jgi:2-hydroxychromene-2-carboxylate isomerase
VPSFRVDEQPALWGQDRLWMLEQDLLQALATPAEA